jgi:hypothetical protein
LDHRTFSFHLASRRIPERAPAQFGSNRHSLQSRLACSMRSFELDTKFQ